MYGKTHNEITYNGITAIKVGEKSTNLTNNEVTLSSGDGNINVSMEDNSISFGLNDAKNYVKEERLKDYATPLDELSVVKDENGAIVDRKIKIGEKTYVLIDEDYYNNKIISDLNDTYLTIEKWQEVEYASQLDVL